VIDFPPSVIARCRDSFERLNGRAPVAHAIGRIKALGWVEHDLTASAWRTGVAKVEAIFLPPTIWAYLDPNLCERLRRDLADYKVPVGDLSADPGEAHRELIGRSAAISRGADDVRRVRESELRANRAAGAGLVAGAIARAELRERENAGFSTRGVDDTRECPACPGFAVPAAATSRS
jgi:hypothetical protein